MEKLIENKLRELSYGDQVYLEIRQIDGYWMVSLCNESDKKSLASQVGIGLEEAIELLFKTPGV